MHCSVFLREIDDNGPTRYVIAVADVLLRSPVTNLRRLMRMNMPNHAFHRTRRYATSSWRAAARRILNLVLLGLVASSDSSPPSRDRSVAVKPFTTIAVALLALIAIAHLLRLFAGWEVTVSGFTVPVWFSLPGFIIAGGLAVMVWRESQARA